MVNAVDRGLPDRWDLRPRSDGGHLLWKAALGDRCLAGPVVVGGRVFVGANNESPRNLRDTAERGGRRKPLDKGVLMCFRARDGAFLWQHVNDKLDNPLAHDWPQMGVCSTPCVVGDRLYYVTNRCEVACLDVEGFANGNQGAQDEKYRDATDADVIWSFDMIKELGVRPHRMSASSPLVVGDLVYVGTGNGVDAESGEVAAPNAPSFIALNRRTGKVVWADNAPGKNIVHGQWSSPAYGVIGGVPQVIFAGGDGWLRAFEPLTGKPIWKFNGNPKSAEGTPNHFVATPVIANDRVYIGTGQNPQYDNGSGDLWCIAPAGKSGELSADWHFGGPDPDPKAPAPWRFGRTISTVAVNDGLLYIADVTGMCYCLDARTGDLCWRHDAQASIWASPMCVDGKVLFATRDGEVLIFRHGREKSLLSKTNLDEPIQAAPVVAGGVLYVAVGGRLYALIGGPRVIH